MPKGIYKHKPMSKETKRKISEEHKGKKRPEIAGKNSRWWKGGKYVGYRGYKYLYKPNHPTSDKHGYIREHRWIMEQHIGKLLKPTEIVHHNGTKYPINSFKDKGDNRIENLILFFSKSAHIKYHQSIK